MVPGIAPIPAAPMAAKPKPQHMFVLGTGFAGRYVSERLLAQGWRVSGTCTGAAKKMELKMLGVNASVFDATRGSLMVVPQQTTHAQNAVQPMLPYALLLLCGVSVWQIFMLCKMQLTCSSPFHPSLELVILCFLYMLTCKER